MKELCVIKPEPLKREGLDDLFKRLGTLQDIKKEGSIWKDSVDIKVNTGCVPFFQLHPLADLHIGAMGTNMNEVKNHLSFIKETPAYTVLCGDLGDMFSPTKHPEGMMGDAIPPDEQLVTLQAFFKEFQDKILGSVQDPSHMDWVRQVSGIEPQRWISQDLNIPLLRSGGIMNLQVNDQVYKILLFHKIGRFNSSLNITNAGKRMLDMHADADVVISGHTHIGAYEKLVKRGGTPIVLNLGTFKTEDDFGTRNGLVPRPQPFFPTLFFDSRKHNIEIVEDLQTSREMSESMRNYFKKKSIAMLGLAKRN
jgi:hypothetical protein